MKRTVFVIGAGASAEVEIPVGSGLTKDIAALLEVDRNVYGSSWTGDQIIGRTLRMKANGDGGVMGAFVEGARHIRDAMQLAASIDNFIDVNRDDKAIEFCGKLAIILAILRAESRSKLKFVGAGPVRLFDLPGIADTWYVRFLQVLIENCPANQLEERFASVCLIIFNYDRCVEHFLYHALQLMYPEIGPKAVANLILKMAIFHPYGTVGALPWYGVDDAIQFGQDPAPDRLLALVNDIKTFTEGTDPSSSEISKIRKSMRDATRVVFLGFAFHRLNMDLLAPFAGPKKTNSERRCFSTGYGVSASDAAIICDEVNLRLGGHTKTEVAVGLECSTLFRDYSKSLSLLWPYI